MREAGGTGGIAFDGIRHGISKGARCYYLFAVAVGRKNERGDSTPHEKIVHVGPKSLREPSPRKSDCDFWRRPTPSPLPPPEVLLGGQMNGLFVGMTLTMDFCMKLQEKGRLPESLPAMLDGAAMTRGD